MLQPFLSVGGGSFIFGYQSVHKKNKTKHAKNKTHPPLLTLSKERRREVNYLLSIRPEGKHKRLCPFTIHHPSELYKNKSAPAHAPGDDGSFLAGKQPTDGGRPWGKLRQDPSEAVTALRAYLPAMRRKWRLIAPRECNSSLPPHREGGEDVTSASQPCDWSGGGARWWRRCPPACCLSARLCEGSYGGAAWPAPCALRRQAAFLRSTSAVPSETSVLLPAPPSAQPWRPTSPSWSRRCRSLGRRSRRTRCTGGGTRWEGPRGRGSAVRLPSARGCSWLRGLRVLDGPRSWRWETRHLRLQLGQSASQAGPAAVLAVLKYFLLLLLE